MPEPMVESIHGKHLWQFNHRAACLSQTRQETQTEKIMPLLSKPGEAPLNER